MKRLYFLVPSVETASRVTRELQDKGVSEHHIYILGKDRHKVEIARLHRAGILQTTDFLHALLRGVLIGGIAGFLVGLLAMTFPPQGLELGRGIVIILTFFGLGFGAWVSTLIGVSVINPNIVKFEKALDAGEFLILIDIPKEREDEIIILIQAHHPEALIEHMPLFP